MGYAKLELSGLRRSLFPFSWRVAAGFRMLGVQAYIRSSRDGWMIEDWSQDPRSQVLDF